MARKPTTTKSPSMSNAVYAERDRKYEAQDALRTLTRADEIRANKELMRNVKAEAKSQIKTVGKVLQKTKTR